MPMAAHSRPTRAAPRPPRAARAAPRPRRGRPEDTRERLITAAAVVFNRDGYDGTDSNRLARAAGYAPATFYKHFADKREVFLAVYERWVDAEWSHVEREIRRAQTATDRAVAIVELTLRHHRRWRGLRASLRALVVRDATVRAFYRRQRRRQLETLARLVRTRRTASGRARHAVLLYTLERVCDAIADGELRDLDVALGPTIALLRELVGGVA
jgi:AcrR family transcriptional regulator